MFSVTSLGFLPFMALFVCLWYRVPQPSRWKLVLAANAVFCLSIDIGAFFAVALATAVVWQAAQHAQPEQPSRRGWLALGLAAALLPLLVLKYSGMLVPGLRDLYKPFGLAYYSLQLAGYLLDVWHGRTAPTPSYARLWCYAGFFLSLTQGPFNRYNTLMPQLEAAPKTFETQRLVSGLQRSAWGYFKKFAIADRAAIVVSAAFADPASFDRSQLIFATVMYSFQLYADYMKPFGAGAAQMAFDALYKKLEAEGYLARTSGADLRSKRVALTEKGEHFARAWIDRVLEAEAAALCAMPEAERAAFVQGLHSFCRLLEERLRESKAI